MQRLGKLIFYFLSGTLSLIFAMGLSLLIIVGLKTRDGPLDLSFLKPTLTKFLIVSDHEILYETLELHWPQLNEPMRFRAHNVSVNKGDTETLWVRDLEFQYPLSVLLGQNFLPQVLTVDGLRLKVTQPKHSQDRAASFLMLKDIDLDRINAELVKLAHMKRIEIKNAIVTLDRGKKIHDFVVNGDFSQSKRGQNGHFQIELQDTTSLFELDVILNPNEHNLEIQLTSQDLSSKILYGLLERPKTQLIRFDNSNVVFAYKINTKTLAHHGILSCVLDGLSITQSSLWETPLSIPQVTLTAELHENDLVFEPFTVDINFVPLSVRGAIKVHKLYDCAINLDVITTGLTFEKVPHLWPEGAAAGARSWIAKHIKTGNIPKATFSMRAQLNLLELLTADDNTPSDTQFSVTKLGGEIHIKDVTMTYVESMSPVTNLEAIATYDHDHFNIHIVNGMNHGVTIQKGNAYIGRFSDDVCTLAIEANILGGLKDMVALINQEPLTYGKSIGIDSQDCSGQVAGEFKMSFPLASPFDGASIKTHFMGTATDIALAAYQNIPLDFKGGDLTIELAPSGIIVSGVGNLSSFPANLNIARSFSEEATNIKIDTLLSETLLQRFVPGLETLFIGQAPTTFTYQSSKDNPGKLFITSDLTKVSLNTLLMKKKSDVYATIQWGAAYEGEKMTSLGPVHYQDQTGWSIDVSLPDSLLTSTPHTQTNAFTIECTLAKKPILKGTIQHNPLSGLTLDLKGTTVDIKTFLDTDLSMFDKPPTDASSNKPMHVIFEAKKITNGLPHGLLNTHLISHTENGKIQSLTFEAIQEQTQSSTHSDSNQPYKVRADIHMKHRGIRKLRLQSADGGAFLKFFGVFENIRHGSLEVVAFNDLSFHSDEWIGMARMRSFSLMETPLLARLLSFTTANVVDKGAVAMDILKCRFGISKSVVKIHGLRTHGTSVGVSLAGLIQRTKQKLIHLKGTMVPMKALNSVIANIPLVGTLLTGGKHEGLFSVSFGVEGTMNKPEVISNPISALAPGIMKQVFSDGSDKLLMTDEWLNSDDRQNDLFDNEFHR